MKKINKICSIDTSLIVIFNFLVISSTKRTSSSSGFSSARSERSDSSNSLSNEPKTVHKYVKMF